MARADGTDPALVNTPVPLDGDGHELLGMIIDGRYRLDATLGRGGMGLVYRAAHVGLRRQVAVKILHPSLAASPDVRNRFEREALAVGKIDHPNCVSVYDVGRLPDGSLYLAMELLDGHALADVLEQEGQLVPGRALHILAGILRGLSHIHNAKLIHRDIKPENIFLIRHGQDEDFAKILDFGIAKPMEASDLNDGVKLTQAGMAFGTPIYMAPEQALGNPMDGRADLYAAAVMAYEMLCGQPPFYSDDKLEVMSMHTARPVPPMRQRMVRGGRPVPSSIERLIARGLTKRPSDRYASADEFLAEVEHALRTPDGGVTDVVFERVGDTGSQPLVSDDGEVRITGASELPASEAIADAISDALAMPRSPAASGGWPREATTVDPPGGAWDDTDAPRAREAAWDVSDAPGPGRGRAGQDASWDPAPDGRGRDGQDMPGRGSAGQNADVRAGGGAGQAPDARGRAGQNADGRAGGGAGQAPDARGRGGQNPDARGAGGAGQAMDARGRAGQNPDGRGGGGAGQNVDGRRRAGPHVPGRGGGGAGQNQDGRGGAGQDVPGRAGGGAGRVDGGAGQNQDGRGGAGQGSPGRASDGAGQTADGRAVQDSPWEPGPAARLHGTPMGGVGLGLPYTGPNGQPIFGLTPEQRLAGAVGEASAADGVAHALEPEPRAPTVIPRLRKRMGLYLVIASCAIAVGVAVALITANASRSEASDELDPNSPAGKASEALDHGDPGRALQFLDANPTAIGNDARAQLVLGHVRAARNESGLALAAYEKALQLRPALEADGKLRAALRTMAGGTADYAVVAQAFDLWVGETGDAEAKKALLLSAVHDDIARRKAVRLVIERRKLGNEVDWLKAYSLDLEQDQPCEARKEAVAKLRALGDRRAVEPLERAIIKVGKTGVYRGKKINGCLIEDAKAAIGYLRGLQTQ